MQHSIEAADFSSTIAALQLKVARRGINYSLDRLMPALHTLMDPHLNLPTTIHIAGTNGKGSVAHYMTQILCQQNAAVLTYTSPHIQCYTERFLINGTPISKQLFSQVFADVAIADQTNDLSEYEMLTLMAFQLANIQPVDYLILETGLGGRLDATNVVPNSMAIITDIGLDHQALLGSTLDQIAKEKAGIIKPDAHVITHLDHSEDVLNVIKQSAKQNNATIHWTIPRFNYHERNKTLASVALNELLQNTNFEQALSDLSPPFGRLSATLYHHTPCQMDVGHNSHAVQAILGMSPRPSQWIIGMNREKDYLSVIQHLIDHNQTIFICEFDSTIAVRRDDLPTNFLPHVHSWTLGDNIVKNTLFFGSFYFIDALLSEVS